MTVTALTTDNAAEILRRSLNLPAHLPSDSVCAELVRASLWAATRSKPFSHTKEVTALAARSAALFGIDKAELGDCLDRLEEIGDVAVLSGGYWSPGVLRYVTLPKCEDCLLVGGTPAASLNIDTDTVHWQGNYRRVHRSNADRLTEGISQGLSSWMAALDSDLVDWASEILACDVDDYHPRSDSAEFQIYAPALSRKNASQSRRWHDVRVAADGRHLARQASRFPRWTYSVVVVEQGHIVAAALVPLPQQQIRRLFYALDVHAGNPVIVKHWPARYEFELWSELPVAELRLFAALGQLVIPSERYYPRIWKFKAEHQDLITEMLHRLRIELAEAF